MFSIVPNPTFEAEILIPVHGGEPEPVCFIFKHKDVVEMEKFYVELSKMAQKKITSRAELAKQDAKIILKFVEGWRGIEEEFSEKAVLTLIRNYQSVPNLLLDKYKQEIKQAQLKN